MRRRLWKQNRRLRTSVGPGASPSAPGPVLADPALRELGPDGRPRWARRLRIGLRPFQPGGPTRLRCVACCRALSSKTRRPVPAPVFVLGYHAVQPGFLAFVCLSHALYPLSPCSRCGQELYEVPGPAHDGGRAFVDRRGTDAAHCPWCWATLPAGAPAEVCP